MFNFRHLFGEEDRLALLLREQFKNYETRVSLAMIPFYMERVQYIGKEIQSKLTEKALYADIEFLNQSLEEVNRKLAVEKSEVQSLATALY